MIFVTGGTGLVGSYLICELLKAGKNVRALKRKNSDLAIVRKVFSKYFPGDKEMFNKVDWVVGDVLDIFSLEDALEGISQIYHSAALISFNPSDRNKMMKINIEGTANIVNIALEKNIKKLCYVSSIAALGRADNDKVTTEETQWKTSKNNSYYAISKYGGEREVWRGVKEGLDAIVVNPSVILGSGGNDSLSTRLILTIWKGLKVYTKGMNGYVDVRDVARSMVQLMESEIVNERFIINSENLFYRDFFVLLAGFLGKKPPSIMAPRIVQELAWRFFKITAFISGTKPFITKETARTSRNIHHYSNEKIKKAIGIEFIPVSESLKEHSLEFVKGRNQS